MRELNTNEIQEVSGAGLFGGEKTLGDAATGGLIGAWSGLYSGMFNGVRLGAEAAGPIFAPIGAIVGLFLGPILAIPGAISHGVGLGKDAALKGANDLANNWFNFTK
ncbi:hypothetical protein [Budvicia diplopodorum]|uniref:hypothetical protein n=1 Tax=Budvicia diplopodorum TaxID=1119056 RepID=UPI001358DD3B|nr:hypothetical protein [Budvicia diplopodorum]